MPGFIQEDSRRDFENNRERKRTILRIIGKGKELTIGNLKTIIIL